MKLKELILIGAIALASTSIYAKNSAATSMSDSEIKKILVQESLASYFGNCPCPEYRDRTGRRCGKRSAYSRPGGESPLCYESDVTSEMINNYRR